MGPIVKWALTSAEICLVLMLTLTTIKRYTTVSPVTLTTHKQNELSDHNDNTYIQRTVSLIILTSQTQNSQTHAQTAAKLSDNMEKSNVCFYKFF